MKCAHHPEVETSLRCGKCGQPICPKCLVPTPVGARCPDCAGLQKLPTYTVSTGYYLRAIGTALGMSLVCGLAWGFLGYWSPFYLNLLLAPATGYAVGQVVSRSVNRKRGKGLAAVAGLAVAISYLISLIIHGGFPFPPLNLVYLATDLVALGLGIWLATTFLR